jgi:hypothetical protein
MITHPFPCDLPDDRRLLSYRIHSFIRSADAAFHFDIALASDWRAVDVPADSPTRERPLATLAFFRTLSGARGEIEVDAALLPREIAPGDCLDMHLAACGEEVLHRRDVDGEGGRVSDVLSQRICSDGTIVSRWLAIKDGQHLFLLQARTAEDDYGRFAEAFLVAFAAFRVKHRGNWPFAESLKTFTRRDPGDFLLLFPESWELTERSDDQRQTLTLTLFNRVGRETAGLMTFATVARALELAPQTLANRYVEELMRCGVPLGRLSLVPSAPLAGFEEMWQAAARAEGDAGSAEVRLVVGKRPDAWFLIGLLGPTRSSAPGVWAVNNRAFDIVVRYLKTPDAAA